VDAETYGEYVMLPLHGYGRAAGVADVLCLALLSIGAPVVRVGLLALRTLT
jgi:hypothetical protein